jgi:hypothetical protein
MVRKLINKPIFLSSNPYLARLPVVAFLFFVCLLSSPSFSPSPPLTIQEQKAKKKNMGKIEKPKAKLESRKPLLWRGWRGPKAANTIFFAFHQPNQKNPYFSTLKNNFQP